MALVPHKFNTLLSIPRPPMLIDPLIPVGSLTMVVAPAYTGKTFFAVEAARAVVTGTPFMGLFPTRQGTVLLVEEDAPLYDVGNVIKDVFIKDWEAHREDSEHLNPVLNFYHLIHQGARLNRKEEVQEIIKAAATVQTWVPQESLVLHDATAPDGYRVEHYGGDFQPGVDLLIFDSLRQLHMADENDATQMQYILRQLRDIQRATGATVLLLHHANKADMYRGSTVIKDAVDTLIVLSAKKNGPVKVTVEKARAVRWEDFSYVIRPREGGGKEVVGTKAGEKPEKYPARADDAIAVRVTTYLKSAGGPVSIGALVIDSAKWYEVETKTDEARRSAVRRRINALILAGKVRMEKGILHWLGDENA